MTDATRRAPECTVASAMQIHTERSPLFRGSSVKVTWRGSVWMRSRSAPVHTAALSALGIHTSLCWSNRTLQSIRANA